MLLRLLLSLILVLFLSGGAWAKNDCRYDLSPVDQDARTLEVEVHCADPKLLSALTFKEKTADFVTEEKAPSADSRLYRLDLFSLAAREQDYDTVLQTGRSILASPDAILPATEAVEEYRLYFHEKNGVHFASGYEAIGDGGYRIAGNRWDEAGALVLGQFNLATLPDQDGMRVLLMDGKIQPRFDQLTAWLTDTARSNSRFWHHPPIKAPLVILIPEIGQGLRFGRVNSGSGAVMLLLLGTESDPASLYNEWVAVHEFLHLGSPLMRDTGAWVNEGIATYFEPLLRYRAGWKTEDEIWQEWINNMPRGLPAMGESGLRLGRRAGTYWGGAIFMLLSDIGLRKASHGQIGMEDCLTTALNKLGAADSKAHTMDFFGICDSLAHNKIVSDLAHAHIDQGKKVDLDQVWSDLGVSLNGDGTIRYNEQAPFAWLRHSLVSGNRAQFAGGINKTMPLN